MIDFAWVKMEIALKGLHYTDLYLGIISIKTEPLLK